MPDQFQQIIDISLKRYDQYREVQTPLAQAYQAIANYARDEQRRKGDPRALLRFLTRPHADRKLRTACQDVFRQLGTSPIA